MVDPAAVTWITPGRGAGDLCSATLRGGGALACVRLLPALRYVPRDHEPLGQRHGAREVRLRLLEASLRLDGDAQHELRLRRKGAFRHQPPRQCFGLAQLAAGRFDGYWETGISPWDVAAGVVLVREAGGFVTEIEGGADPVYSGSILAANPTLHEPISRMLRGAMRAA